MVRKAEMNHLKLPFSDFLATGEYGLIVLKGVSRLRAKE
jgi:hypothetical protein